jgi:AcrR family transcriptional regulator
MPRVALFRTGDLLDTAERLVAEGGPRALTIEALTAATGAPVGSIYHRFSSRAVLAAELWLRAVERFQAGLISELGATDVIHAGENAALHTLRWSRRNWHAARMLLLYRDIDFIAPDLPEQWAARAAALNDPLLAALRDYGARRYGSCSAMALRRVGLAIVDLPYGAVHRHLAADRPIPQSIDRLLVGAVNTVLASDGTVE